MKEVHFFGAMSAESRIVKTDNGVFFVTIERLESGCFAIEAHSAEGKWTFISQPIVYGMNRIVYSLSIGLNGMNFSINMANVKSSQETMEPLYFYTVSYQPIDELSFENVEAKSVCASAMEERKRLCTEFWQKGPVSDDRRPKTVKEMLDELRVEQRLVHEAIQIYESDPSRFLILAGRVFRTLINWKPNSKNLRIHLNNNPLLFRVAGLFDIELPIYYLPNKSEDRPEILKEASVLYKIGIVGLFRELPGQVLIDLQDWMLTIVQEREGASNPDGVPASRKEDSVIDLLAALADTAGSSHYDPSVPLSIDTMKRTSIDGFDSLALVSHTILQILAGLIFFVFQEIDRRQLVAPELVQ